MADIQYLNYGDQQIEQQAFLDKAKKEVYDYVRKQPWSTKRKERFMSAYSDIMTRGVLGASVDDKTGLYKIQVGGDVMNISPDDQKIYGDAAAYLQEQMASLPTKASLEEEAKKKAEEEKAKLPIFDNEYFKTNFINHLSKNEFGGSKQFDTQNDWNGLDKRDEKTGLRGREERAKILARNLQSYADSLDETKLNFEGSPFENLQDFKDRINKAVYALTETPDNIDDDNESLRRLGIRASDWFNNGSGDPSGQYIDLGDGTKRELTYGELAQHNQEQENKKLAAQKQAAYNNTLFINRVTNPKMQGRNPVELKEKYKDSNSLLTALQGYAQQDIRSLTPDEISEVHGAYRNLANTPIDSKLLSQLQNSSSGLYKNSAPNRFKKINGIDNLVWDSVAQQVIQINNRQQQQALQNQPTDLFKGVQTQQDNEKEYLNSKIPGITNAEWKELSAIGLDIASILNPEAITGSGMALGAAALRHSAKNDSNPDWSLGDYVWQGLDYLTGALGGIQVAGDLVLSAKTMATASKAIPILRKMARFGAWTDLYQSYPDLKEATRKITSGEELTVKDWRAIGQGIRGLVSHGRLNRGNRAERRVLEKSGQNVTPENISSLRGKAQNYSQKLGFTRTKPTNTSEISIVKATVNGKESEIEISPTIKAKIQEKVQKAGNNTEARNKAVKEVLESEGKIKASDKVEVEAPSSIWDGRFRPNWIGTSRNLFGTKQVSSQQGNDVFNDYISGNRSYWDRYKYGSNTELKGIYNRLNINNSQLNNNQTSKPSEEAPKASETPKTTKAKPLTSKEIKELKENIKEFNKYTEGTAKHSGNHLSEEPFKAGDFDFEVSKFPNSSAGNTDISFNGKVMKSISFDNQKDMMKKVANFLKENRKLKDTSGAFIKKFNAEKMGEILKQLKAKGVFKQGGRIDKQKIQKYKNFINK